MLHGKRNVPDVLRDPPDAGKTAAGNRREQLVSNPLEVGIPVAQRRNLFGNFLPAQFV
jgi:hypothetical protein